VRYTFSAVYMTAVTVFPLILGTLPGYYRDINNPELDQIFFQLHYNISSILLLILALVVFVTAIRFRRSMNLNNIKEENRVLLKNPILKVCASPSFPFIFSPLIKLVVVVVVVVVVS